MKLRCHQCNNEFEIKDDYFTIREFNTIKNHLICQYCLAILWLKNRFKDIDVINPDGNIISVSNEKELITILRKRHGDIPSLEGLAVIGEL